MKGFTLKNKAESSQLQIHLLPKRWKEGGKNQLHSGWRQNANNPFFLYAVIYHYTNSVDVDTIEWRNSPNIFLKPPNKAQKTQDRTGKRLSPLFDAKWHVFPSTIVSN